MSTTALATPAWILPGRLRNLPGMLVAGEGNLAFVGDDVEAAPARLTCGRGISALGWPRPWAGRAGPPAPCRGR
jgi:hypothetical protein